MIIIPIHNHSFPIKMRKENGIKCFIGLYSSSVRRERESSHWLCGVYCELLRKQVKVIVIVQNVHYCKDLFERYKWNGKFTDIQQ